MLYLDTLTLQMWPEVIKFNQDLPYLNQDLKCLNIDLPCLKQDLRYLKRQELQQVFTAFPHRLCLKVSKFQKKFPCSHLNQKANEIIFWILPHNLFVTSKKRIL